MCGICGFYGFEDGGLLGRMCDSLKHRGPDDSGKYIDDNISLGHRRLAIIDLEKGHQPMHNEDESIWITYNGEVFNYRELRGELEMAGHRFYTNSDTEVVVHAYEEYGQDCVKKFNGQFAFAIWDGNKKILFLARDRFGIKPLYHAQAGGRFIFASEIKSILEHPLPRKPNDTLIFDFLAYDLIGHTNQTFFEEINKLPKGCTAVYDTKNRTLNVGKYWETDSKIHPGSPTDLKNLLADSVKLRLRSDVPVGSCLSGGLDSSSIVCMMSKMYDNIETFSAVFPGNKVDESEFVDECVKHAGVSSNRVIPSGKDFIDNIQKIVYTQEEPFSSPSIYMQWCVFRLAHEKKIKVLLDGQGGDELFAGYRSFYYPYLLRELLGNGRFYDFLNEVTHYRKKHGDVHYMLSRLMFLYLPKAIKNNNEFIYRIRRLDGISKDFFNSQTGYPPHYDLKTLDGILRNRLELGLEQLLNWEDKNSMAFSVEARLPLLDYRVVNFVMNLPAGDKIHRGETKAILRRAMSDMLPQKILARQDKKGFTTPSAQWLRESEVSVFVEEIINSKQFNGRKYFNAPRVQRLFKKHMLHREDASRQIWKYLSLELWLREYFEGGN